MNERRKFRREGEERRRQDLIDATLDSVAEHGLEGASLRTIALRAGVTAGLIRHYFPGKEELLQEAYMALMGRMTEQAKAALVMEDASPRQRLAAFVTANLNAPIIDARVFSLWATFIGRAGADPSLARAHREGYLGFRNEVEAVVANGYVAGGVANLVANRLSAVWHFNGPSFSIFSRENSVPKALELARFSNPIARASRRSFVSFA